MLSSALVLKCFRLMKAKQQKKSGHRIEHVLILCVPVHIGVSVRVRRQTADSLNFIFTHTVRY